MADPDFPKKTREKRTEDIRPCIGCLQGCLERLYKGQPITCLVNPSVGKELESWILPAPKSKRICIVGGGPAGMEAARIAASRGHEVTLWEKNDRLGGQFYLASLPPYKEEVKIRVRTQAREIRPDGVMLEFSGQQEMLSADTVVLAAGAKENRELKETQQQLQVEFYAIGDCREARKALEAIHEGFQTALHL